MDRLGRGLYKKLRSVKTSEKIIEKKLTEKVNDLGGWSLKLLSTYVTGLPDRLCLLPGGRVFFVEVKTTGKKPTKIQERIHDRLRGLGFEVTVIDSLEQIQKL